MKNKFLNLVIIFVTVAGFACLSLIAAESPFEPNLPSGPNMPIEPNISAPNVPGANIPGANMPGPNIPFEPNTPKTEIEA
ncbi:MAG: hypothetical protein ABFD79_15175 [Phycisphaerales bacterium]